MIQKYCAAAVLLSFSSAWLVAQTIGPRDADALPASEPVLVQKYGADAFQFGKLRLSDGKRPFPVVVVINDGCWTKGFATLQNTAPIASDLAIHGVATWNIEYRQVGDAVDYLRVLGKCYPVDLSRVVVIGHSAGANADLWVAARNRLAAGSEIRGSNPLRLLAAVAIDGPGDLAGFVGFDSKVCGQPERYRQVSLQSLLPLGVPLFLVVATVLKANSNDT